MHVCLRVCIVFVLAFTYTACLALENTGHINRVCMRV